MNTPPSRPAPLHVPVLTEVVELDDVVPQAIAAPQQTPEVQPSVLPSMQAMPFASTASAFSSPVPMTLTTAPTAAVPLAAASLATPTAAPF
ncbi:MAG: hypothetical protein EOP40_08275, partial [Rubrivivax sp.]